MVELRCPLKYIFLIRRKPSSGTVFNVVACPALKSSSVTQSSLFFQPIARRRPLRVVECGSSKIN